MCGSKIGKSYLWQVLEKLKEYIEQLKLMHREDKILVAVSGGIDSMVLLHLLQALNYQVGVAHCNFQLRGEDSDEDEVFVKQYCSLLSIPFFSQRFETNNYATERKLSIQMAARELRYHWFEQVMKKEGYTRLATAHHFNDSIETILLNWVKGGGIETLGGIAPMRGNIIRPLLFATREQVNDYAADYKILWREDGSNQMQNYQRNFIRHQVIPQVKRLNVSLENTLMESNRKIAGELGFFYDQIRDWKSKNLLKVDNYIKINKEVLAASPHATVLLWHCIREYGFSYSICDEATHILNNQPGKQFLSESHRMVIDRLEIIISSIFSTGQPVEIGASSEEYYFNLWKLVVKKGVACKPGESSMEAVLDFDKLVFPLIWRKWASGDYFYPLGMNRKKKLSDFLIDKKVSLAEKDTVTVLESNGEIIWVVGHRLDNRYRLTENTQTAISFTLYPYLKQ